MKLLALALVASIAPSAYADLLLVPDQFPDIQAAVDASQEGDAILITTPMNLPGFQVASLSVSIFGGGSTVGEIRIQTLSPQQSVTVSGFQQPVHASDSGLTLVSNEGPVHIQDCVLRSPLGGYEQCALVLWSDAVTLTDCEFYGKPANLALDGERGDDGLYTIQSTVTLNRCSLIAGGGGAGIADPCTISGTGGSGADIAQGDFILSVDNFLRFGLPGAEAGFCGEGELGRAARVNPGGIYDSIGDTFFGSSAGVNEIGGETPRSLTVPAQAAPNQNLVADIEGVQGDWVLLIASPTSDARMLTPLGNTLCIQGPFTVLGSGVLDPSGQGAISFSAPGLLGGESHLDLGIQALAFPVIGPARRLSNPRRMLVR